MTKVTGILPEDVLSEETNNRDINGVNIRKGTVAAVLANIDILENCNSSSETKRVALQTIQNLVPALIALGLGKHVIWKNQDVQRLIDEALKKI